MEQLKDWDGQSPPTARTYQGKPVVDLQSVIGSGKTLPNFGAYAKQKKQELAKLHKNEDLLKDNTVPANRPENKPTKKVPSVDEVIGRALDYIGTYNDLDNR